MINIVIKILEAIGEKKKEFWKIQLLIFLGSIMELAVVIFVPLWFSTLLQEENSTDLINTIFEEYRLLTAALTIFAILFSSFLNSYILYKTNHYSFSIGQKISRTLLVKYLEKSYDELLKVHKSVLLSRINTEASRLSNFVLNPLFLLNTKVFISLFIILFLLYYDLKVTFFACCFFIIVYFSIFKFSKRKLSNNGIIITNINSEKLKLSEESINAFIEITLYNLKSSLINQFKNVSTQYVDVSAENNFISKFPKYLIEGILFSFLIALLAILTTNNNFLTTLAIFGFGSYKLLPYLQQIFSAYSVIKANVDSVDILLPDLKKPSKPHVLLDIQDLQTLELSNICFSYGDKPLFKNYSCKFERGNIYGIIGESGSGKSTLAKIILGLLQPDNGSITVNSVQKLNSWIDASYVSQNTIFINESIGKNLLYDYNGTEDENFKIIKLLSSLGLDDLLKNIDYDLNVKISERGNNVSGGQLQRLSIARAILKNSELLILDEATSALDDTNQLKCMSYLRTIKTNRITIIITHRKETIAYCDHIIEL